MAESWIVSAKKRPPSQEGASGGFGNGGRGISSKGPRRRVTRLSILESQGPNSRRKISTLPRQMGHLLISFVSAHAAQITWPHGEQAFLAERAAPPSRAPNASLVDARIPGANATKRRRWFSREASLLDALRKAYDKAQRCLHAAARHEHRPHARQGRGGGERLRRRPQALHPTAAGLGERCAGRCPRSGRRAAPPQRHAQPIAAARLLCGDVALHEHRGERHLRAVRLHPRQSSAAATRTAASRATRAPTIESPTGSAEMPARGRR